MRRLTLSVLSVAVLAACQPGVAPLTDEDIEVLNDMRTAHVQATLAGDCDARHEHRDRNRQQWRCPRR